MAENSVSFSPPKLTASAPLLVGIGETVISTSLFDIIVAPNLGSCLGIAMLDAGVGVGGMVHCMLPLSSSNPQKAKDKPGLYVDTGMVALLQKLIERGADKKRIVIAVGGGANMSDVNNVFEIGKKNHTVFKKVLWKNGMLARAEHVGDSCSRTVALNMQECSVTVRARGELIKLI